MFLKFLGMWPTISCHCLFLHNRECKYKVQEDDIIILLQTVVDLNLCFFGVMDDYKDQCDAPAGLWTGEYLAPPLMTWAGQPCSSQWLVHHRLQINAQVCEDSLFLLLFALLFSLFLCHLYLINEVLY